MVPRNEGRARIVREIRPTPWPEIPRSIVLTHGDPLARVLFMEQLTAQGLKAMLLDPSEKFLLLHQTRPPPQPQRLSTSPEPNPFFV